MRKSKAFTLVELLIVVIIIGILATLIVMNFNGARTKAIDNSALTSLSEAAKASAACIAAGDAVQTPFTGASSAYVAGGAVCSPATVVDGKWPSLASYTGWTVTANTTFDATAPVFAATATSKTISCTMAGCTKTGF